MIRVGLVLGLVLATSHPVVRAQGRAPQIPVFVIAPLPGTVEPIAPPPPPLPRAVLKAREARGQLQLAEQALAMVPASPANEDAANGIADLKKHFAEMTVTYLNPEDASDGWERVFSDVERDITRIVGGGSAFGTFTAGVAAGAGAPSPDLGTLNTRGSGQLTGSNAGEVIPSLNTTPGQKPLPSVNVAPGANPLPGVNPPPQVLPEGGSVIEPAQADQNALLGRAAIKVSTIGIKDLDPAVRKTIENFRVEIEYFLTLALSAKTAGLP